MSAILRQEAETYFRSLFTKQQVYDVLPYRGEFSGDDLSAVQFASPAVLVGLLASAPVRARDEFQDPRARAVTLIACVASNKGDRKERSDLVSAIAERLCLALQRWRPDSEELLVDLAAPELLSIRGENMTSGKLDGKGYALWIVTWRQCVIAKPGVDEFQLVDVDGIDIYSTVRKAAVDDPADEAAPLAVRHQVDFEEDTPTT